MALAFLDWLLIGAYFVFSFSIAIYFYRRAGQDTNEFFLSGRNMPWWIAGTSMVATTFAADTPLLVTELVATDGIAGNWLWWNMAFGGMLTVFFFARLWRRSGVLTDVEFVELRYSGAAAGWLRGIKAIYFGLLFNCLIIGWVALAMETIVGVLFPDLTFFGQTSFQVMGMEFGAALAWVGVLILVVAVYSLLSGLWGVMVTDFFQFIIAMTGTTILAFYALDAPGVGGISGLMEQLPDTTFRLLPTFGETAEGAAVLSLSALSFVAYIGVQWWSSWYPGSEPGGGGYIAQRMMSAKNETHSLLSTLWFTIAHYCLRPWPWIIVALTSLVLYPGLDDTRRGFVLVMRDVLPPGLLGLLTAAFLAAFMSTVSTQLNWGVSYLVNDFWRRFIKRDAGEKHYVFVSRVLTFVIALISVLITANLGSIREAWSLILSASAGLGLVLILRWYWWRVNAWSELTATVVPVVLAAFALFEVDLVAYAFSPLALFGVTVPGVLAPFPLNLYGVVAFTTVFWLAVTYLTRPTRQDTLDHFYRHVRPGGPGWRPLHARHPDVDPDAGLGALAIDWIVGVVLVYTTLFGVGYLILGRTGAGLLCMTAAAAAGAYLWWDLSRQESERIFAVQEEDTAAEP